MNHRLHEGDCLKKNNKEIELMEDLRSADRNRAELEKISRKNEMDRERILDKYDIKLLHLQCNYIFKHQH